jgi:hypothetical protein
VKRAQHRSIQASDDEASPPGGLAEFNDDGTLVRAGNAANDVDPESRPYDVLVEKDRLI